MSGKYYDVGRGLLQGIAVGIILIAVLRYCTLHVL